MNPGGTDAVRIVNVGDEPFRGRFEQRRYVIDPGANLIAAEAASWHWLGRGFLTGKERHKELDRLHILYASNNDMELWEQNKPKLECYAIDGDRISTVVDDPEGDSVNPVEQTKAEKSLLEDQLTKLRQQMAAMQQQLGIIDRGESQPEAVPEDDPKSVPVGARRGREIR